MEGLGQGLGLLVPGTVGQRESDDGDGEVEGLGQGLGLLRGEVVPVPGVSPPYLVTGTVGQRESDDGQGAFRAGSSLSTINLLHVASSHLGVLQLDADEEVAVAAQQEVEETKAVS